jgi:hypothetical protein
MAPARSTVTRAAGVLTRRAAVVALFERHKMTHYDKTLITFHRGNAFTPEGIDAAPFAILTINDLVDRKLIDAICALMRKHINAEHQDFCNIKLSTEDWDS